MFSLSLHSKSDRFLSSEYLSHDLDGSSKQSYSIFLKENKVTNCQTKYWQHRVEVPDNVT